MAPKSIRQREHVADRSASLCDNGGQRCASLQLLHPSPFRELSGNKPAACLAVHPSYRQPCARGVHFHSVTDSACGFSEVWGGDQHVSLPWFSRVQHSSVLASVRAPRMWETWYRSSALSSKCGSISPYHSFPLIRTSTPPGSAWPLFPWFSCSPGLWEEFFPEIFVALYFFFPLQVRASVISGRDSRVFQRLPGVLRRSVCTQLYVESIPETLLMIDFLQPL